MFFSQSGKLLFFLFGRLENRQHVIIGTASRHPPLSSFILLHLLHPPPPPSSFRLLEVQTGFISASFRHGGDVTLFLLPELDVRVNQTRRLKLPRQIDRSSAASEEISGAPR